MASWGRGLLGGEGDGVSVFFGLGGVLGVGSERGRLHISQTSGFEYSWSLELFVPSALARPGDDEPATVCDGSAGSTSLR